MAALQCFEDIEAWKVARTLTREIYAVTSQGNFARDFGLRDQMRRASVSIMSNIAEGFERGGTREFLQFLSIAKGSSAEVRAQLYVALDAGYVDHETFLRLNEMALQVGRLLNGFMRYLQTTLHRGTKNTSPSTS